VIAKAQHDAIRSQLDELRSQIHGYEDLVNGKVGIIELGSLKDLPQALIQARIAAGLSQRDLAEKLGLKEQQIQKYEATDYQQASLSRLLEVAEVLHLKIRKDLFLSTRRSEAEVFARLRDIGLSKDFVLNRLVPREVAENFVDASPEALDRLLFDMAGTVSHVFGWTPAAVIGGERPWLDGGVLGTARFKLSENAEEKSLTVYTFYAHFLALLLLKATEGLPVGLIPTDPDEVHQAIIERHGSMSFRNALLYCWDLGIPVLPLNDSGAFHGACWRVEGRNVIVLKQRTSSLARWLFDLLHEFRHAGEEPGALTRVVIEDSETSPERLNSEEEKEASWFAGEVILGGRAEALAKLCEKRARGSIERLKSVVQDVAEENGVDVAALANYLAFRLSWQGENWWGAATNLQPKGEQPWEVAREVLLHKVNLSRLNGIDRELFVQALRDPEG
jgi:transcriptional regulator with XRE-family HTH domain/Zn-dependent peptidase ImmA (M78 family)